MAEFQIVTKYDNKGINLPRRKTAQSAGYDFEVAADIVIPSIKNQHSLIYSGYEVCDCGCPITMSEMKKLVKMVGAKPTLVPTGIKCKLDEGTYLELSARSSLPLNHWLILANGVGIIDADYYNNPDNEGEIFFQLINLSPYDIIIQKGEAIGQGIIKEYSTVKGDCATGARVGGFGSTSSY